MHKSYVAALLLPASLALTSCAAFSDSAGSGSQPGGRPSVVASFYPLQFLADRIAGDRADISTLTQPGQEPHDLELTPAQTGEVAEADILVVEHGLQAAVDDAVKQVAQGTVVDAAQLVQLQEVTAHDHTEDATEHDTEHDAEDDAGLDTGHDTGHDHGSGLDPHFWQDPARLAQVAAGLEQALAKADPKGADTYATNLRRLRSDLDALDKEYAAGLAHCQRDTIVVSHDAFGYLAKYGLHIEPVAGLSPDAEPTPADLARLHHLIEEDGITTVFGERLASPALTRTLATDAGVATAVLDPIEGLTDETSDQDYLSLMRANLQALRKANGCQ